MTDDGLDALDLAGQRRVVARLGGLEEELMRAVRDVDLLRQPVGTRPAAARSRRARPVVQVTVSTDESRHQVQDLQSLALHEEAVRLVRADPALLLQAQATLERWLGTGSSRSSGLWREWQEILRQGKWRKILGRTRRAQELRQASPLTAVLPAKVRQGVLDQVGQLRKGLVLGGPKIETPA
jgi:hypothetical protein